MGDLGTKIHALTQQIETIAQEAVDKYLDLEDFMIDTRVSQTHIFKYAMRRFKKVDPNLALPPYSLSDYTNVTIEYDKYDAILNIKRGETSSDVTLQTFIDDGSKA